MNRKTLAALGGVLIIALALVGLGYGLWFEDLQLMGYLTTGYLDVNFSPEDEIEWFSDEYNNVIAREGDPLFELKHDQYVSCEATRLDEPIPGYPDNPEGPVDTGPDLLQILITGAYPSYHCLVTFDITNAGTVPVHFMLQPDPNNQPAVIENFVCDGGDGSGKNCTLTQGYWKNHSLYGPAPYDPTWALVGEDTPFYTSGMTWYEMINAVPGGGNVYIKLAHQYIAATLNGLRGADLSAVAEVMANADAYFQGSPPPGFDPATAQWILDGFNGGVIGPGHCEGDDGGQDGDGSGPFQLHPNEHLDCEIEFHFMNDDPVTEGQEYRFFYAIRAYQWNEDDAPALGDWFPFPIE